MTGRAGGVAPTDSIDAKPILSIDAYNQAETEGSVSLSIPHIMAFKPVSYQMVGWPHTIGDMRELARFADHNFEAEIAGLFEAGAQFEPVGYRNAFTHDEKELLAVVRDKVRAFTAGWFGRRVAPVTNILVQMGPFRMVNQLGAALGVDKPTVFEPGPGAGYLGAFLTQSGHRYASYDVAQSYYLWQSCLMQATGGADFSELAALDAADRNRAMATSRIVHIPWWHYVSLLHGTDYRCDIVYSNSNLSEMSRVSLRMLLHTSKTMLQDSPVGAFTFFSKGMPAQTPHEQIDEEFRIFGYHKVFDTPFSAYVLDESRADRIREAFADGIVDYDPSGRGGAFDANEVSAVDPEEAPLDTALTQWYHGWNPPFSGGR
ncbi:MAG: hypothetical protein AAGL24_29220 [Pseudomonadota bacterium]